MSGILTGRYGSVKIGSTTILSLNKFDFDESASELDASCFGNNGWGGTMPGQQLWKATIDGFLRRDDVTGQAAIITAKRAATKLTNVRFYVDNSSYSTPDITNDSNAGAYITAMKIGVAQNALVSVNFTITGVGPICDV